MSAETEKLPIEILGIGDAMVDLSTHASQLPPRGGNIWSTAVNLSPGGTTANVAAIAARLGMRSAFVGCVGDDPYGQYTISELKKVGVDTQGVIVRPGAFTGIVLAIIDDAGERTFIACAKDAAHSMLKPEDLQNLDYRNFQVLHTSGVCLGEQPACNALLSALKQAQRAGCLVYFDPNLRLEGNIFPDALREAQWNALAQADVILIGDEEIHLLFEGKTCREGVEQLHQAGAEIVVVKQGELGATTFSDEGEDHFPAFQVEVTSTTGAGDSFDAGFIAARQRNASLHDALVYACAVAALKVTRLGARAGPRHTEVMSFLAERGHILKMDYAE